MKAQDLPLTQLLEGSKQFVIPIFQRTYSWDEANCRQLCYDIIRVGSNPDLNSHFIGGPFCRSVDPIHSRSSPVPLRPVVNRPDGPEVARTKICEALHDAEFNAVTTDAIVDLLYNRILATASPIGASLINLQRRNGETEDPKAISCHELVWPLDSAPCRFALPQKRKVPSRGCSRGR